MNYREFKEKLKTWHKETGYISGPNDDHPIRQELILSLPRHTLISYCLLNIKKHFHCVSTILALVENPPPIDPYYAGRVPVIKECWIYWGLINDYIKTNHNPNKYWLESCFDSEANDID